jgi:hypothetical protein
MFAVVRRVFVVVGLSVGLVTREANRMRDKAYAELEASNDCIDVNFRGYGTGPRYIE